MSYDAVPYLPYMQDYLTNYPYNKCKLNCDLVGQRGTYNL